MASSSSSSPAPAFSSRSSKYHVFLSFRGEDTRNNFVGHLYSALEQKGIQTYKDDKTLRQGETIGPALMKGIDESQIALVVFSDNYADSSWCLNELAYIMNCKKTRGQIVMPVFYKVDPSEVRKQEGKFGEAFEKHESKKEAKLDSWREALNDVGSISGFHYKDPATRDESEFIKDIVEKVSKNMRPLTCRVNDNLVGIETRMEVLESKLQIGSGGAGMIGIWGVGGGGKTTLASSFYHKISGGFDGHCFVEDVREKSNKNGLERLQEKVLSDVLKQDQEQVRGVEEGKGRIRDRLCCKKVLMVLDDVNNRNQLEALAGSRDWFGEGSLIIITTRDVHLLNTHQVDVIHKISLFKDNEAMQLFCRHAFRHHKPKEGYKRLSKDVVTYAGGLPLALTVIGCFLCDKDMKEWRSALARLKEIPETDIVEKLKISYDGLKTVEKELFLDIACFYRGRYKTEETMAMLDACGFYPVIGIKVLIQKALITISEYGRIEMHDLVQEMGHHIVRGEYPEKHSRVWKKKDVIKRCAMDATKGLDMIKAISIDWNMDDRLRHLPSSVAKMKNLRWIDWRVNTLSPFPTNFPPVELCCLTLDDISLKRLWNGYKLLPNLKIMELYRLHNLIMTPDFDGLPYLERFKLSYCRKLEEIHPSIGRLEKLVFLSVESCSGLKMFPPITQLKELKTLSFLWCTKLLELTKIQQQKMHNLGHLHLDNSKMRGYSNLHADTQVKKPREYFIDAECCLKEPCLPHMKGLQMFHTGLRKLKLFGCNVGDMYFGYAVWSLPNLQELDLRGNTFSRLDFSLLQLPRLKWLNVSLCEKLVELSQLPSSIAAVEANFCTSLGSFGDISNCKWLWKVSLVGKNKLGPLGQEILLRSMLQGNAIEDHAICVAFEHQMVPKEFVGRMFRGQTCTLHLPHDWYTEFCGFLICIFTDLHELNISIIIKHDRDEDSGFEVLQECNEALEPKYDKKVTAVGYVSFGSFRHPALSNSSYNMISFSIENMRRGFSAAESYVGAVLMPRKSKCHQVQTTTDCSEFYDKERADGYTFRIQHDSESSIKILLKPYGSIYKICYPVHSSLPSESYYFVEENPSSCVIC